MNAQNSELVSKNREITALLDRLQDRQTDRDKKLGIKHIDYITVRQGHRAWDEFGHQHCKTR